MSADTEVAVVGAGPFGLGVANALRSRRLEVRVFDRSPLSFWREHMPQGMLLRSPRDASHIGSGEGTLTVGAYESARGEPVPDPVPIDDFLAYATWFLVAGVGEVDRRDVAEVSRANGGFRVRLGDGDELISSRVVVATGIAASAWIPEVFRGLPRSHVSHTADHKDVSAFSGKQVLVVGAGQSALESAALLHEAGALVEVAVRAPVVRWLRMRDSLGSRLGSLRPLFYTREDVGPPGLNHLVSAPDVFRRVPRTLQTPIARRAVRPAGAGWLLPRLVDVPIRAGREVARAAIVAGHAEVVFADGRARIVDHVLLGTGYRYDVRRESCLAPPLLERLRQERGYPVLVPGLESSVPGLHFAGASAAWSFGPVMRFVCGSWFGVRNLTDALMRSTSGSGQR